MRVLVVQFLRGMFESSKDHILLSTNPRSAALRKFLIDSPQHEFVMLSINRRFKSQRHGRSPKMILYDIPPTRMLWLLYVFLFSLLTKPRLTICFGIEITAVSSVSSTITRSDSISVIGSDIEYLKQQYRLPQPVAKLIDAMVRLSLRRASYVFAPNQRVLDTTKLVVGPKARVSEFKYRVSSIFAPSSGERRRPSANPVVLTVSRLSPVKGLEYLVLAAKEVLKSIPDTTFVIQSAYTDPAFQQRLENLMTAHGVRDHFKFGTEAIPNSEMPRLYNTADLFVMPSLTEGRNSAILEALACGLPVVATRVGANDEVVVDMKNGFLVEPRDASALAERIVRILKDHNLWLRLSEAARSTSAWGPQYDLGAMLTAAAASIQESRAV